MVLPHTRNLSKDGMGRAIFWRFSSRQNCTGFGLNAKTEKNRVALCANINMFLPYITGLVFSNHIFARKIIRI